MKIINFVTEQGTDYGAYEFTLGSGGYFLTRAEMYENTKYPMCWPSFFKPQWLEICRKHHLKFYNFDGAYFGNQKKKNYFRLSVNNFQNTNDIIDRPNDRLEILNLNNESFKRGSDIVIVPPDRKICHTLDLGSVDDWINTVVQQVKQFTDRNIRVRYRPESRGERTTSNTFKDFIRNNTYCVIGYSSNSLVEAAICDIPVIPLGHSATRSLYKKTIKDIEILSVADQDLKQAWMKHLSYCQFTRAELLSGYAWDVINQEHT